MTTGDHNFIDDRHNLYCGWVFGLALKWDLPVEPVCDDAGNFTDRFTMKLPDNISLTFVIPPPPDDWVLSDSRTWGPRTWDPTDEYDRDPDGEDEP